MLRRVLRYVFLALLLIVLVAFASGWWIVHRALPQLDGTASLPGLKAEVTVNRDAWGIPHIQANSLEDLAAAQGYVMAQDRLWQMDVLRRVATGELSEIFGPRTLALDREYRTLGLRIAAEREAGLADPELRAMLQAYARGVNRYIEERRGKLPWEFVALRYEPQRWRPADSLLIFGYMYRVLANSWQSELARAQVTARVGVERAKELYAVDSPLDHYIVGESAAGPKSSPARKTPPPRDPGAANWAENTTAAPLLWEAAQAILQSFDEQIRAAFGSNHWVVNGTHTASGKPLLANDTHLQLGMPCIWYIVHLTVPGWSVKGFALPGAPLVIIGHNDRIAWGFTNNGADVQDLYIEKFNPANPHEYLVNGKYVPAKVRTERIRVRGRSDELLEVVVTRHGPIVHRESGQAYALRWTATEPGGMPASYSLAGRAQNWAEFRDLLRRVPGPAQNAVYADVDGNIGYLVAARIPMRKCDTARNTVPCGTVPMPGDTDDFEWTGYIPFDELPQVLNPPGGVIATANARVVGPAYPHYLTERWVSPYRTERIYELLAEKGKLRPEDFIAIQTDIVSLPHRFLAGQLVRASQSAQAQEPRAHELLARLRGWNGIASTSSVEMSFVEYTRRALMRNLLRPYLGADVPLYQWWRDGVFLENVLRERPARWLPKGFSTYDALLIASADQAVRALETDTHSAEISRWRWGQFLQLEMLHPLGQTGWLRGLLGIGPIEQPGAANTVKQTGKSFGPAMRFVADLSNWDNSLMNVTTGESGQWGSPHYKDQFPIWFEGRGLPAAFSDSAETQRHQLRLLPAAR